MTISIHLVSIPEQEAVTSRVIHLPIEGGCIGRSPDCNIVLPDHTTRISRKHAEITRTADGYFLKDLSNNGLSLNTKRLHKGVNSPVNDGDIVEIEGYSLLVSTLVVSKSAMTPKDEQNEPTLTLNLNNDDTDFLEELTPEVSPQTQHAQQYSAVNILSDDPFASDPFENFDKDELSTFEEIKPSVDTFQINPNTVKDDAMEFMPVGRGDEQIADSLQQLIALSKKNNDMLKNPSFNNDYLFNALEETIDSFLDEFCPKQLESQFNEYLGSSLFTSKEKRYWRIYSKHFERRQQNGEFKRQFKALFIENMQRSGEE